jgi:hypothetical protein
MARCSPSGAGAPRRSDRIRMANLTASISLKKTATKSPFSKLPPELRCMIFKEVLDSHTDAGIPPLLTALEGRGNEDYLAAARYVRKLTVTPENIQTFESTKDPSLKSYLREITLVLPIKLKTTPLLMMNNLVVITIDMSTHFDNQWWLGHHSASENPPNYMDNDKFASLIKASKSSALYPTNTLRKFILRISVGHEKYSPYGEDEIERPRFLQTRWINPLNMYFGFSPKRTEDASGDSVSFTWEVEKGEALVTFEKDKAYIEQEKARAEAWKREFFKQSQLRATEWETIENHRGRRRPD